MEGSESVPFLSNLCLEDVGQQRRRLAAVRYYWDASFLERVQTFEMPFG